MNIFPNCTLMQMKPRNFLDYIVMNITFFDWRRNPRTMTCHKLIVNVTLVTINKKRHLFPSFVLRKSSHTP